MIAESDRMVAQACSIMESSRHYDSLQAYQTCVKGWGVPQLAHSCRDTHRVYVRRRTSRGTLCRQSKGDLVRCGS